LISMIMQMRNPDSAAMDIRGFDPENHWRASEVIKNAGWIWFNAKDDKKCHDMRIADMESELPKKVRRGIAHIYKVRNHGGTSRTKKYAGLHPGNNTAEGNALAKRIEGIRKRIRRSKGFQFSSVGGHGVEDGKGGGQGAAPAAKRKSHNAAAQITKRVRVNQLAQPTENIAESARPSKRGKPSSSDDAEFTIGKGQTDQAQTEARRSARARPSVDYSEEMQAVSSADVEPPSRAGVGEAAAAATADANIPVVCAVEVGSRVMVYWGGDWGWCPCKVTAISNGKINHPTNRDEFVMRGYAIVHYEKTRSHKAMDCVHNLDREHHFGALGEQQFAWREPPDPVQASADHVTGAQGGKFGVQGGEQRMREGDEDSSDDEDRPLADRRFVKSNQPGGSDPHVDPVQASADHVTGAQGGEQRMR
jgi:hypothetical protein